MNVGSFNIKVKEKAPIHGWNIDRIKKKLLGAGKTDGLLKKLITYALLLGIGFVYLYPLMFMIVNSLMDVSDLVNPTVRWVPTRMYFGNYRIAYKVLDASKTFGVSLVMAGLPALFQTACCAVVGYGFARFEFPLKRLWMLLLVITFIIPGQVTMVPRYMLFDAYGMINTPLPSMIPALLGQGIKSTIFVLVFYQFFHSYPKVLDEAGEIDGAGKLKIFLKIALPMSVPAIVVAFLFSFVWYWNETYLAGIFFGKTIQTLPMRLQSFVDSYNRLYPTSDGSAVNRLNESIRMAGTMLTIVPMLLMYTVLQKQFVESVDRAGITGE
ncbi:ABC transporter permease [Clostridium thermosuccinogenes]|jgi:multiple sugar transport system permease protein|uniref:ABC transporter permease n=1 Tax=Clostridium thermosuccinogenes TaxID=84032 RepID=A0A2K2FDU2_9CLOT|nr:carbohydrate ABC transporter permease [Pseudoclostridium thermosuccinogenes]AUS97526.1 ABC transporter permease [Pseudoclostridium thermosuccinogenes]PNT93781.1 ABC transporter permease [Pseudoclostridium thermosuccinogenes]PNT96949.1 ABC transporter permease [Pseudoclostridium thermosuccinogenes]PNT98832.1 ABC transporter permease [Pseudoclostridium thermosuccinogenes]